VRVLVCGGRDFTDRTLLYRVLDEIKPSAIVNGAANGADALSSEWARDHNVPRHEFPAQWQLYGKAAGPVRNQRMLLEARPQLVVAFKGGRGTADMIRQAEKCGIKVRIIR
jgi:hypothetical protein